MTGATATRPVDGPVAALLEVSGLAVPVGEGGAQVSGLDLRVESGALVQLVGPVEAGTAVLRALVGLVLPGAGVVRLLGQDPAALGGPALAALLARVGWLPREGALLANLTLRENLLLPLQYHRGAAAEATVGRALERLGLARCPDLRPERVTLPMRRRVALARALLLEPALLLLDHPLDDLDAATARVITAALRAYAAEPGRAVLLASPVPEMAAALGARPVPLTVTTP